MAVIDAAGSRARLRPVDVTVIAYNEILIAVLAAFLGRLTWQKVSLLQHLALIAVALGARRWAQSARALPRAVATFYPLLAVPLSFSELAFFIRQAYPDLLYDARLRAVDVALFGRDPILWFEGWHWPLMNEILLICYLTFYFLPVWVALHVMIRGERARFEQLTFEYVGCFLLSYLGYLLVPAIGPRFYLGAVEPIRGVFAFDSLYAAMNRLEAGARDCFPSGHTAVTLLVMIHAARFARPLVPVLYPLATGLLVATMYLRMHLRDRRDCRWAVDRARAAGVSAAVPWLGETRRVA
ncbi:MAG: phosphatase PAP2 family protein [Planctomycetota bacterium]